MGAMALALIYTSAPCQADDLFIPESNSLKRHQNSMPLHFSDSAFGMDNKDLEEAVQNLRSNAMSSTQRQLNYQWLQMHSELSVNEERYGLPKRKRAVTGGKAVNQILKMGWRTYWEQKEQQNKHGLLPSKGGKMQFEQTGALEYDVRLSGDKLNFSFELDF